MLDFPISLLKVLIYLYLLSIFIFVSSLNLKKKTFHLHRLSRMQHNANTPHTEYTTNNPNVAHRSRSIVALS